MKKQISVAIALLCYQQKILIGWRDETLHQGGCYEFAGGKIERNETPSEACRRETIEEVGIDISLDRWHLFKHIYHEYDDALIDLYFFKAKVEEPELALMNPSWQWVDIGVLHHYPFPKANQGIIQALQHENRDW